MNPQTTQLFFIIAMVAVFYFLVLRPQQKRVAQQRAMIAAIEVGDEIVTVGGIFATVVETGERLRVRVADGSEFELAPQAVGNVIGSGDDAEGPSVDEAAEDGVEPVDLIDGD